jgi:hypothetical protein
LQLRHQIKEPGFLLGVFERILFFSAIWLHSLEVVGGWLAFKVASKWAIYEHIIAFPQSLVGVNDVDYLIARRQWAAQRLMRFLIGTIANVLLAFSGVLFGQLLV